MGKFNIFRYRTSVVIAAGQTYGDAAVLPSTLQLNGVLRGISIDVPDMDGIQVEADIMGQQGEVLYRTGYVALSQAPLVQLYETGNGMPLEVPINLNGVSPIRILVTEPDGAGAVSMPKAVLTWSESNNFADGETVTINGPLDSRVYRFKTTLVGGKKNDVLIGTDGADSLLNLYLAIVADGGARGTKYHVDTQLNDMVTADDPTGNNFLNVYNKANVPGPLTAVSTDGVEFSWDDTTLTDQVTESAPRTFTVDLFIDRE